MFCLRNIGNNLHLKLYAKDERPKQKSTLVNTIKYDMKAYQVNANIVNYTDILLKGLEMITYNRSRC